MLETNLVVIKLNDSRKKTLENLASLIKHCNIPYGNDEFISEEEEEGVVYNSELDYDFKNLDKTLKGKELVTHVLNMFIEKICDGCYEDFDYTTLQQNKNTLLISMGYHTDN